MIHFFLSAYFHTFNFFSVGTVQVIAFQIVVFFSLITIGSQFFVCFVQTLLLPVKSRAFVGTFFTSHNNFDLGIRYLELALRYRSTNKLAISQLVSLEFNNGTKIEDIEKKFVDFKSINEKNFQEAIDGVAFWNLNHMDFSIYLQNKISKYKYPISKASTRYLPEYATNMGHLGLLFLYLNHFRKFNSILP